jgi:hypothetical protein
MLPATVWRLSLPSCCYKFTHQCRYTCKHPCASRATNVSYAHRMAHVSADCMISWLTFSYLLAFYVGESYVCYRGNLFATTQLLIGLRPAGWRAQDYFLRRRQRRACDGSRRGCGLSQGRHGHAISAVRDVGQVSVSLLECASTSRWRCVHIVFTHAHA